MSARSSLTLARCRLALGAVALPLLLGACAAQPYNARGAVVAQAMYQPAEASNPYTQTAWRLRQWSDVRNQPRKIPTINRQPAQITLVFQQGYGRRAVSGVVACNQFSGDYTVANGLIILTSDLASTAGDCGSNDLRRLEQDFLEGMKRVVETTLDDYGNPRLLTLRLANGDRLEFARDLAAPPT